MSSKPAYRPTRTRSANTRSVGSRWERLESRELLSTAYPTFSVGHMHPDSSPASGSYTPAQIQQAYQFNQILFDGIAGNGAGETIAIVDAYDDPNIQSDLNTFDSQFNLPAITITKVNESGGTILPSTDPTGGWEVEESLDVEWAHAMAPAASILLVEASSPSTSDLLTGVNYAAAHANVVSMSWGAPEFSGETSYDSDFSRAGVAFVASSGDNGAPASWPAVSPNVLAVGGTALTLSTNGTWSNEVGWSGSGGGPSAYEPQPSYQSGVVTSTTMRANPDVAYDASPSTGFAVYDSNAYYGTTYGWMTVGGTSAGAPQWAALVAIADEGRTLSAQAPLNSTNAQQVMDILYAAPGDFHDITSGTSTGTPNYTAGPGYDYVTGEGTPIANDVVDSLDANPALSPDTLVVSAPSTATAGNSFTFTVTAEKPGGAVDTDYTGTVQFSSSDAAASLPANYTFTTANDGSHSFVVTFATAGSQSLTVKDVSSKITATVPAISVVPAAPVNLTATAVSASQINLGWGASAGDTGYLIQHSTNGGSSWTQIASVSSGTTSYQNTGLSAGTTYEYRILATGGGLDSAPSNVAAATITSGATVTDSIWGNSYTPSENATSGGAYELGLKFTSSEAGDVTGVRFYKISSMNGYTHVGHLWSSTGTLLATAAFTNETSSGWQQVNFSSPVPIAANTIYIVSFSSSGGTFGITKRYFSNGGVTNAPLQALPNSTPGGNGVYNHAGHFPDVSGSGMNFWVDVAFSPSTNPAVSTSPASAATSSPGGASPATGPTGYSVVPPIIPAPAGPPSFAGGVHAATTPAAQSSLVRPAARTLRLAIRQPRTTPLWRLRRASIRGSND
jgi:hypothetical protein